jgi:hypothetical protein
MPGTGLPVAAGMLAAGEMVIDGMSELDCPVTPWRRGVASLHRLRGQPARCPGLAVGLSQPGGLLAARHWLPGLEVRRCQGAAILWR